MMKYRGVEKDEIIRSIHQAAEFLLSLNVGPHTNAWAKEYVAGGEGLQKLHAAATDAELAETLMASARSFKSAYSVLLMHALYDTNQKGLEAYKGLCRWRAFNGAIILGADPAKKEIQNHCDQLFPPKNKKNIEAVSRFEAQCEREGRNILDANNFAADPIADYGLVMETSDQPMSGSVAWSEPYRKMVGVLGTQLGQHLQTGDVDHIGSRSFNIDGKHIHCVFFSATRSVAQEVADRYAGEKEVITEEGERIVPSTQIQGPAEPQGRAAGDPKKGRIT